MVSGGVKETGDEQTYDADLEVVGRPPEQRFLFDDGLFGRHFLLG